MYLHIGDNFSIPMNSIITMIHAESGKHHRTGIQNYDAEVIYVVPEEKVKTYIVTDDGVYASGISLKTLKKRIDEFYMLLSSKLQGFHDISNLQYNKEIIQHRKCVVYQHVAVYVVRRSLFNG